MNPRWPYLIVAGLLLGITVAGMYMSAFVRPSTRQLVRCWYPNGDLMYEGHAARTGGWGSSGLTFKDDRTGQQLVIINMPCTVRSGPKEN